MYIKVKRNFLTLVRDDTLIQGAERSYPVVFSFDESWSGVRKTALFRAGDHEYEVNLTEEGPNGWCLLPPGCLEDSGRLLQIGVRGVLGTEVRGPFWVTASLILPGTRLKTPSGPAGTGGTAEPGGLLPENWRQIVLDMIHAHTAEDEEVIQALDEIFGAPPSETAPGQPICAGTATDEEVDQILNDIFGS